MPAMIVLINGLYASYKEKIAACNRREKDQKREYDATIREMEMKKQLHDASAAETYNNIEKYWTRQRAISHRQYHTALKIMHAGMQKFKSVAAAMADAVAGKKPSAKDLRTIGLVVPEVVFLQVRDLTK